MKNYAYLLLLGILLLGSCKTPHDITYLQDVRETVSIPVPGDGSIRFRPGDKLSIYVHSREEKLMALFNLQRNAGSGTGSSSSTQYAYTVNERGEIDFPVLGAVKVMGLTRTEVAELIKDRLVTSNNCKDAVVTVEFYNMTFSVLGTVGGAGMIPITKDRVTLLDAIAMASDLQIDGLRRNVLVMRQEGDRQVPYRVDLTSAESVYNSPVYYIRQNDVVYVEPNDKNKRNSTVMGSNAYQPAFWMSLATFCITIGLFFTKL